MLGVVYWASKPYFSLTCALRIAAFSEDMSVNDILSTSFMSSAVKWDFGRAGRAGAGMGAGMGAGDGDGDASVASDASDASGSMT